MTTAINAQVIALGTFNVIFRSLRTLTPGIVLCDPGLLQRA